LFTHKSVPVIFEPPCIYFEPKSKYPGQESVNILTKWTTQLTK